MMAAMNNAIVVIVVDMNSKLFGQIISQFSIFLTEESKKNYDHAISAAGFACGLGTHPDAEHNHSSSCITS